MLTIGRIPRKIKPFFGKLADRFGRPAFRHFSLLVLAITVCHGATIDRLAKLLRGSTHRTKHGEFLYKSDWDAPSVIQQIALDTLLTELAAVTIHNADLPENLNVIVLFDAYYLCDVVADACRARGWHFIGVGKGNRNFTVAGQKRRLDGYGRNVLNNCGRWHRIRGLRRSGAYRVAERVGLMKHLGEVKVVFSRRRGERKTVALVTDDLGAPAIRVVGDYLKRWAVELLIKDEKQHLGLGDYRVLRYRAVVRHLALVDIAYACLTHLALSEHRAQGHDKNKSVLRLAPISQLKAHMRQVVWQEAVEDVVKHAHEKHVIRRLEKLIAA
jgi:hypothetical protein